MVNAYQNTIGERKPSIWAGPPVGNFNSYVVDPGELWYSGRGYAFTMGERRMYFSR